MTARRWSEEDRATLRAMAPAHTAAEIAAVLGRTERTVKVTAWTLGVRLGGGVWRRWTEADLAMMRAMADTGTAEEIAIVLARTAAQVYAAAQRHGVELAGGAAKRRRTDARISRAVAAAWRDPEKRARMHDGQLARPLAGAAVAGSLRRLPADPAWGERHAARLYALPLYRAAQAVTPRWLDPDARQDVIADLVLACLSGEVAEGELASALPAALRRHRPDRRLLSLDEPITPGGRTLRIDLLRAA